MHTSSNPSRGWLVATHAVAVILGAAGVLVVNQTYERTVIVKPMIDFGQGEPISLGQLLGIGGHDSRISANENAAIATLRSIAAAQQQFHAGSVVDTDADGGGEYGYFGELSGGAVLRGFDGTVEFMTANNLRPPFLATAFGDIFSSCVERQGYLFQIFLPGPGNAAVPVTGFAELAGGGSDAAILASLDAANNEIFWCCYAWPQQAMKTGNRAFFINQERDVIQFENQAQTYNGYAVGLRPLFSDAYDNAVLLSMGEALGLGALGNTANANIWTSVGN